MSLSKTNLRSIVVSPAVISTSSSSLRTPDPQHAHRPASCITRPALHHQTLAKRNKRARALEGAPQPAASSRRLRSACPLQQHNCFHRCPLYTANATPDIAQRLRTNKPDHLRQFCHGAELLGASQDDVARRVDSKRKPMVS